MDCTSRLPVAVPFENPTVGGSANSRQNAPEIPDDDSAKTVISLVDHAEEVAYPLLQRAVRANLPCFELRLIGSSPSPTITSGRSGVIIPKSCLTQGYRHHAKSPAGNWTRTYRPSPNPMPPVGHRPARVELADDLDAES